MRLAPTEDQLSKETRVQLQKQRAETGGKEKVKREKIHHLCSCAVAIYTEWKDGSWQHPKKTKKTAASIWYILDSHIIGLSLAKLKVRQSCEMLN